MPQVKRILITKKDFSYSKGNCNLNFTLQIDNNEELKMFRECLIQALKDIEKEIKR